MKTRCSSPLLRCAAISLMIAAISRPAVACSLRAPWEINDPLMIAFIGSPLPDTVLAGDGPLRPVVANGHSGLGTPRVAYGQRVRVDRVGDQARRAFPPNTREVVLVPWDYAADCRPVAWAHSARWLPDALSGLFRARLRPQADWAQGIPTFDIIGTYLQPYRERPLGSRRDGVFSRQPRLSASALLSFYDMVPRRSATPDTIAAMHWLAKMRADTGLVGHYPVDAFEYDARSQFGSTRAKAVRVPMAGTFRLDVSVDADAPRTLFLRVSSTVTSLQDSMRGVPDRSPVPRLPEGYYVYATSAPTLDKLATNCRGSDGSAIAYVDLDWHAPLPADGTGAWKAGIDGRLLEVILSQPETGQLRERRRVASAAAAESLRTVPDSVLALRASQPRIFIPNRPLRVSQNATGPMRVEGTLTIPQLGTLQIHGERISKDPLPCAN